MPASTQDRRFVIAEEGNGRCPGGNGGGKARGRGYEEKASATRRSQDATPADFRAARANPHDGEVVKMLEKLNIKLNDEFIKGPLCSLLI